MPALANERTAPLRGSPPAGRIKTVILSVRSTYEGFAMATIATIGIDRAISVFSIHAVSDRGAVQMHCTIYRAKLVPLIAQISPCLIGMTRAARTTVMTRR